MLRKANYSMRYRCTRCHIKIETASGLCNDCKSGSPLIQYDAGIGDDRFFRRVPPSVNVFADFSLAGADRFPKPRGAYKH